MKPIACSSLLMFLAIGVMTPGMATSPTWRVHLETAGTWKGATGIVVDSTGYAVTLEPKGGLSMPRCTRLDEAALATATEHISWLSKNANSGENSWRATCNDDTRVRLYVQHGELAILFRYPLLPSCQDPDDEPPAALTQLVDQLMELRAEASERCVGDGGA